MLEIRPLEFKRCKVFDTVALLFGSGVSSPTTHSAGLL